MAVVLEIGVSCDPRLFQEPTLILNEHLSGEIMSPLIGRHPKFTQHIL